MVNPPPEPTFIILYTHIYIYLENHKNNFFCPYGFGHFFCPLRFFPNTAMSGCKPSTYRSIVFLKSWICRTGSDSMSVSSRDSIWGSMLTFAYCFFQHDVEKILVFYGYIQIWWEIWQYLWPDLGARSRLPICSTLD